MSEEHTNDSEKLVFKSPNQRNFGVYGDLDQKPGELGETKPTTFRERLSSSTHLLKDVVQGDINLSQDELGAKNAIINVNFEDVEDIDYKIRQWKKHPPINYTYAGLFRFSSCWDRFMIFIGILAAIASGICIPYMIYIFGQLTRTMVFISLLQKEELEDTVDLNHTNFSYVPLCTGANLSHVKDERFIKYFNDGSDNPADNLARTRQVIYTSTSLEDIVLEDTEQFSIHHTFIAFLYTICCSIYFICWHHSSENQIARMRYSYFKALLQKDMKWYSTHKDRDFTHKILENTRRIHEGIGISIGMGISLLSICIIATTIAFLHGWQLTLLVGLMLPVLLVTSWFKETMRAKLVIAEHNAFSQAKAFAEEIFSNILVVLVFSGQQKEIARFRKELSTGLSKIRKLLFLTSVTEGFMWFTIFVFYGLFHWFGTAKALHERNCTDSNEYEVYDAGSMFIILLCVLFGTSNLHLVAPLLEAMKIAVTCGKAVFWIIDTQAEIDNLSPDGLIPDEPLEGKIEFQDVRFTYPSRKDSTVLNNLYFTIEPKTTVAFVGANGSGKSTLLNLICKMYLADSGFVKIDGIDIRRFNTKWLRSQIGVVSQNETIFDDTIEENVRMGLLDATFYEVQEACKKANAHEFIISFKEGYQTRIGASGRKLSTGEKQRIAIARALIQDPKILILDEPTNSLDIHNEELVMKAIENVAKDRTVIIVAHRLQTITKVDNIFVMKKGRVVEKGTHSNLIKNRGAYSQLATGNYSNPSISIRREPDFQPFDSYETNTVNSLKVFSTKPMVPNMFNNLINVDPVVTKVTKDFLWYDDTGGGYYTKQIRERDEVRYNLEDEEEISVDQNDLENNNEEEEESMLSEANENFMEEGLNFRSKNEKSTRHSEGELDFNYFYSSDTQCWPIFKLLSGNNKLLILIGAISSIILGLSVPIYGVIIGGVMGQLTDHKINHLRWIGAKLLSLIWFIGFILLGALIGWVSALKYASLNLAAYKTVKHLRQRVFVCFLRQDMAFFENPNNTVSKIVTTLTSDTNWVQYIIKEFYGTVLQALAIVVSSIAISAWCGLTLTLYVMPMLAIIILFNYLDGWLATKQQRITTESIKTMSTLIFDIFRHKHSVTTLQLEPYFLKKFVNLQNKAIKKKKTLALWRSITYPLAQTLVYWFYSLFMLLGGYEMVHPISNKKLEWHEVITIGQILFYGMISIGANLGTIATMRPAIEAGENILKILSMRPQVRDGKTFIEYCEGKIDFFNTHFVYPFWADYPVLKQVTLNIPKEKLFAILGPSESGKNAYFELLLRMFDPNRGKITLDGEDITHLNINSIRRHIGLVHKEPQLFTRTVAENIAYGDNSRTLTMKDVIATAKKAGVHNSILSLPYGYESLVGENDMLSSGLKIRIAIARALVRDPKILLIDDLTSLLDRENEKTVLEAIDKIRKGKTCIMISHRVRTIQKADHIVVLQDGSVQQMGTHDELLKNESGLYSKMWRSQNPLSDEKFSKGAKKVEVPPPPKEIKPTEPPTSKGPCGFCNIIGL